MGQQKLTEPSNSPWASLVVLVKKQNGSLRFCVDYRKLNAVTQRDNYPLDDLLDSLSDAQWFYTLNLRSGNWQVELDPADRNKQYFLLIMDYFNFG